MKALANALDRIYAMNLSPLPDGAVYNVGQIHGGEIFNGIPERLYFTMDLRSPDPALLDSLDRTIDGHVAAAAKQVLLLAVATADGPPAGPSAVIP